MTLSAAAETRLAELGIVRDDDLEVWRWLWNNGGEAAFWKRVATEAESRAQFLEWAPRLKSFAVKCRRKTPAPSDGELSPKEHEQHRILRVKMLKFAETDGARVVDPASGEVSILETSRAGLATAGELFRGPEVVILERSEWKRWFEEIYVEHEDDAFSWYSLAWWWIEEEFSPEEATRMKREHPIPPGDSYWLLVFGSAVGPLHGESRSELWHWNGQEAVFLELFEFTVS